MTKFPRTINFLVSALMIAVLVLVIIGLDELWPPAGWILAGILLAWVLYSVIRDDLRERNR